VNLPHVSGIHRRAKDAQELSATGQIPHPHRLVLTARHEKTVGGIRGNAQDTRVVRAHLDSQDGFGGLRESRPRCSQQGATMTNSRWNEVSCSWWPFFLTGSLGAAAEVVL